MYYGCKTLVFDVSCATKISVGICGICGSLTLTLCLVIVCCMLCWYRDCKVIRDPQTHKSKGYGFVCYVHKEARLLTCSVLLLQILCNSCGSVEPNQSELHMM